MNVSTRLSIYSQCLQAASQMEYVLNDLVTSLSFNAKLQGGSSEVLECAIRSSIPEEVVTSVLRNHDFDVVVGSTCQNMKTTLYHVRSACSQHNLVRRELLAALRNTIDPKNRTLTIAAQSVTERMFVAPSKPTEHSRILLAELQHLVQVYSPFPDLQHNLRAFADFRNRLFKEIQA